MLDRAEAESLLYRVASASLNYHPDKAAEELGYTMDEDIDWCLRPLNALPGHTRQSLRAWIGEVITDPTTHRRAFVQEIHALVDR